MIAKSSVVLDVKPWSDETDMMEVERLVRTIVKDGLIWGAGETHSYLLAIDKLKLIYCCIFLKFIIILPYDRGLKSVENVIMSEIGKLVEIGYGIKKLQIGCVVEDDKIGIEELSEEIQEFEDHVQSVDIAAFNKI